MPELPEVETIARTLSERVCGRRILNARFFSRFVMREDPDEAAAKLRGRTIAFLERRGKFLVFQLSGGGVMSIHLGMTGKLLWQGLESLYTRAEFELEGGKLIYEDIRQFGRIEVAEAVPPRLAELGPEPLAIAEESFLTRLSGRRSRIKPLLLDQRFLGGMGNIYADETLFRARLHPRALASRLGRARARRLYRAIQEVLSEAIANGGSSISDYVDAEGRKGSFQLLHRVYGKAGEPCPVCGTRIRRIVVGQRGTHYCPKCQRI